jgi:hypothetical protein
MEGAGEQEKGPRRETDGVRRHSPLPLYKKNRSVSTIATYLNGDTNSPRPSRQDAAADADDSTHTRTELDTTACRRLDGVRKSGGDERRVWRTGEENGGVCGVPHIARWERSKRER